MPDSNLKFPIEDANAATQMIVSTAVGNVPFVGQFLSLFSSLFWPSAETSVWDEVKGPVEQMIDQKIAAENIKDINMKIGGIGAYWHEKIIKGLNTHLGQKEQKLWNGKPIDIEKFQITEAQLNQHDLRKWVESTLLDEGNGYLNHVDDLANEAFESMCKVPPEMVLSEAIKLTTLHIATIGLEIQLAKLVGQTNIKDLDATRRRYAGYLRLAVSRKWRHDFITRETFSPGSKFPASTQKVWVEPFSQEISTIGTTVGIKEWGTPVCEIVKYHIDWLDEVMQNFMNLRHYQMIRLFQKEITPIINALQMKDTDKTCYDELQNYLNHFDDAGITDTYFFKDFQQKIVPDWQMKVQVKLSNNEASIYTFAAFEGYIAADELIKVVETMNIPCYSNPANYHSGVGEGRVSDYQSFFSDLTIETSGDSTAAMKLGANGLTAGLDFYYFFDLWTFDPDAEVEKFSAKTLYQENDYADETNELLLSSISHNTLSNPLEITPWGSFFRNKNSYYLADPDPVNEGNDPIIFNVKRKLLIFPFKE